MDDYDACLYSIDGPDLFEEDESDNDVLDNVDEEQVHTDTSVVLVPACSPTRERDSGDERRSEPDSTVLNLMARCNRMLTEKFGFSGYKGKQKEIIEAAISGADVFVLAPTGMGKSLCFQLPAIAEDCGVSVIVSPLLALMKNQVANLRRKGISAVSLTSETAKGEKSEIIRDLSSKKPKNRLFYTTPEKLCTQDLMQTLAAAYSNGQLSRLVIDEAHCISEWGHDFREEYRRLGFFRERFPGVPVMALTATATKNVQRDIIRSLKIAEDRLFTAVHPFNRTNLFYEVRYKSAPDTTSLMQDIAEFIAALHRRRGRSSSGIIYCRKRGMCDELSNYLRGRGLNARPYHRGISSKTLSKTLKEWETGGSGEGSVDIVCATIAFGMGIDKSDVRYIIHYDLPKSMEGYYQETGRAGRDGLPSRCLLYYSREDALRLRKLVSSAHARRQEAASSKNGLEPSQRSVDSLQTLVDFAENVTTCRHVSICRYFGEIIDTTDDDVMESVCDKMCDVCKSPEKTRQRKADLSEEGHAAAVISMPTWNSGYEDDEDVEERKPHSRAPLSAEGGASAANPGQMTLWDCLNSAPAQGFKRPNAHGRDKLALPDLKRAKVEHARAEQATKSTRSTGSTSTGTKVKVSAYASMPPPLVTRPHSSMDSLRKPFKTPFKTPFKVPDESRNRVAQANDHNRGRQPEQGIHALPDQGRHGQKDKESEDEVEIVEVQINREPIPIPSSADDVDMDIPEVETEVEVSYSRKIPLETRTNAFSAFRRSLCRIFPLNMAATGHTSWNTLEGAPTSTEDRALVLAEAAKKLEHAIHVMCATPSGYELRVAQKRQAMALLEADVNRGRAVIDESMKNGEQPAKDESEDEDKREIMDALGGGVEWWREVHKRHVHP